MISTFMTTYYPRRLIELPTNITLACSFIKMSILDMLDPVVFRYI